MATPIFPKIIFSQIKVSLADQVGTHVKNAGPQVFSSKRELNEPLKPTQMQTVYTWWQTRGQHWDIALSLVETWSLGGARSKLWLQGLLLSLNLEQWYMVYVSCYD